MNHGSIAASNVADVYRKYYGWTLTLRITALMFVTIALAALAIDGFFSLLGLIPSGARPSRDDIFGSIQLDYKLLLNLLGAVMFIALSGSPSDAARRTPFVG